MEFECMQVSNWFINARVRLWKPMVEEMYQQETNEEEVGGSADQERERNNNQNNITSGLNAQTPTPSTTTATTPTTTTKTNSPTGKRSEINATENDPSLITINRQQQQQHRQFQQQPMMATTTASAVALPGSPSFNTTHDRVAAEDTCRRGSMVAADCGTASGNANASIADHDQSSSNIGSATLISFGTTTAGGDVSLTLGLRHAGGANMPEKNPSSFSVRDFGGY